ncbi:hypothetical protein LI328DRAFT_160073 [Trichoderma asperelloides]|nr:hypothetical protein LI328DRAFT_160073 [Trichoderma asperelloides]
MSPAATSPASAQIMGFPDARFRGMQRPLRTVRDARTAEKPSSHGREQRGHTHTHRAAAGQDPDASLGCSERSYEAHGPFALAGAGAVRPSLASLVYDAPAVGGALATSPADRASNWRLRHFGNAVERC